MRVTRLVIRDFFGFRLQEIDLASVNAVVVVGKNGSGKSSILDAVRWGLYGRSRLRGDHMIRRRADEASVRVEFTAQGQSWVIIRRKPRDKTGTLHLFRAIEEDLVGQTSHTVAETQARIDKLIGLTYPGMLATAFMVQTDEERNDLARMDPAKGMDLLVELFDIDYAPLYEDAKARGLVVARAVIAEDTRLNDLMALLTGADAARQALALAEDRLTSVTKASVHAQGRIEAAKVAGAAARVTADRGKSLAVREDGLLGLIAQAVADVARHVAAKERAVSVLNAPPPVAPSLGTALDGVMLAQARGRLESLTLVEAQYHAKMGEEVHVRRELDRIERLALVLKVPCNREGIYATCPLLTQLPDEATVVAVRESWTTLTDEMATLSKVVDEKPMLTATVVRLEDERSAGQHAQAIFEAQYAAWQQFTSPGALIDEAQENITRAKDDAARLTHELDEVRAQRRECVDAEKALTTAVAEWRSAEEAFALAKQALADIEGPTARARLDVAEMDRAEAALPLVQAEHARQIAEQKTWDVLTRAFHRDGIPRMVVQAGLPLIEDRANEVLARMPEDMTLRLVTEGITKRGTVSAPTLTVEVTHEGEVTPYDMLSGAQKFRVDFALRLGLGRVLTHRSGATVETLLLDEPDRDLDEEGREALVESINAVADDFGLIVAISHHTFLTDRFPFRIEVTRQSGESKAVLV